MAEQAILRKANILDAKAIAIVHVASWQVIYRGHIPDNVLDNLSVDTREKSWKALLENGTDIFVLEEEKNLVGFVCFHPSRDRDVDSAITGEISSIYIAPHKWRKGFGRLLLNAAVDELKKYGYSEVTLWVLDSNQQARQFYEGVGFIGNPDDIKIEQRDLYTLCEIRYRKNLTSV